VYDREPLSKPALSTRFQWRFIMPLIQLVLILIVIGVLLWLVNNYIPMQGSIKRILNGVVVIAVVLWLVNVFGLFSYISNLRVGK
jgi:lipopolysaccharide export LptBFGC system permease protein LptF